MLRTTRFMRARIVARRARGLTRIRQVFVMVWVSRIWGVDRVGSVVSTEP